MLKIRLAYNNLPSTIKQLSNDSIWSMIGAFASKSLLFAIWVLIARILGAHDYGEFGIIRNTLIMFMNFAGFGLGLTANRYIAEYKVKNTQKSGKIIGLSLIFATLMGIISAVLLYILSPWAVNHVIKRPELLLDFRLGGIILLFSSVNGAQIGILQGLQEFKNISKINIQQVIISIPFFILGAVYFGVTGTMIGFIIYNLVICFLSHNQLNKSIKKFNIKIDIFNAFDEKKILFTYSLPAFIAGFIIIPFRWYSDATLVNNSNGFFEMGLFTAGLTFQSMILMGANMLNAPFLSVMSQNKDNSNYSSKLLFNINILIPWSVGILVTFPFIIFPELASLIFGKSFDTPDFNLTFLLIAIFTIILMYKQGFARLLAINNLQWVSVLSNMTWGITLVLSFYYLKTYGAKGLALSYLISYILNTIIIMPILASRKIINMKYVYGKNSIAIWLIVLTSISIHFITESIATRLIILIILLVSSLYFFKKLLK